MPVPTALTSASATARGVLAPVLRRVCGPLAGRAGAALPARNGRQLSAHFRANGTRSLRTVFEAAQIVSVSVTRVGVNIDVVPTSVRFEELDGDGNVIDARALGNEIVSVPVPAGAAADTLTAWSESGSPVELTYHANLTGEIVTIDVSDGNDQVRIHCV